MSKKVKKYRLFALEYSPENVDFTSQFRFSRVTPKYILVYAQRSRLNAPNGNAVEVKEEDIGLLSKLDEAWLFDCGISLFADIAAKRDRESMDKLTQMVSRFEQELAIEQEGVESDNESA